MGQTDIVINQKQARIFARAICKDVSAYIHAHQREYEQFLLIKYAAYCDGDVIDAIKTGPKPHRVITLDLPDI